VSGRDYPRLGIEEFGAQLLETNDLDPIYVALHRLQLPREQLCRWLVSYWCLYHAGTACWMSDRPDAVFWSNLLTAAYNTDPAPTGERWPRGAERRHWRGVQAVTSAQALQFGFKTPTTLVDWLAYGEDRTRLTRQVAFSEVARRVDELRGFGPWIAFKIGDMLDRLGVVPVNFAQAEVFMFSTPREAAFMLARQRLGLPENAKLKDEERTITEVVAYLTNHFNGHLAQPLEDRVIGLQEVETILCKWKSHMGGHYPLLKDTHEIAEGLDPWAPYSETAMRMRTEMGRLT
jgi:hypothetical protein